MGKLNVDSMLSELNELDQYLEYLDQEVQRKKKEYKEKYDIPDTAPLGIDYVIENQNEVLVVWKDSDLTFYESESGNKKEALAMCICKKLLGEEKIEEIYNLYFKDTNQEETEETEETETTEAMETTDGQADLQNKPETNTKLE